jgi:hypothetical protein
MPYTGKFSLPSHYGPRLRYDCLSHPTSLLFQMPRCASRCGAASAVAERERQPQRKRIKPSKSCLAKAVCVEACLFLAHLRPPRLVEDLGEIALRFFFCSCLASPYSNRPLASTSPWNVYRRGRLAQRHRVALSRRFRLPRCLGLVGPLHLNCPLSSPTLPRLPPLPPPRRPRPPLYSPLAPRTQPRRHRHPSCCFRAGRRTLVRPCPVLCWAVFFFPETTQNKNTAQGVLIRVN